MTTIEIAKRLVELCKQGKNIDAIEELYADDAVSIEPPSATAPAAETHGRAAQLVRIKAVRASIEIHAATCEGPWPHGDRFVLHFTRDATVKATGARMTIDEMGVYTVANGKITRSEFFYVPAGA